MTPTFVTVSRHVLCALALCALLGVPLSQAQAALWLHDGRPTTQAQALLETFRRAADYGLDPRRYTFDLAPDQLAQLMRGEASAHIQEHFETELTAVATRFVRHLSVGRVRPRDVGFDLPPPSEPATHPILVQLAASRDVATDLAALEPQFYPYRRLKEVLGTYRDLSARAELSQPLPPSSRSLRVGERYAGTPQLRMRLQAFGDLLASPHVSDPHVLDPALIEALQRFQARHGLMADGILGQRTFAELNRPLAERVQQLELSMERWRWLERTTPPQIVVNIPQFMLYALPRAGMNDTGVLEMPVVVGERRTRTPVFQGAIDQVVFRPFWDIPRSIAIGELLPKIRQDFGYLERQQMELVRGQSDRATPVPVSGAALAELEAGTLRLRQRPGPHNSLGLVKFLLPNPYSVYLHDTPAPHLFARSERAFSHGCVRVSNPAQLAAYVLKGARDTWDEARIEAAFCGEDSYRVRVQQPTRVLFYYATAAATQTHGVLFFNDIYGHDRTLAALLR